MADLHLISWNLHGLFIAGRLRERMAAACDELAQRAPDVVLLQEVWSHDSAAQIIRRLAPVGYAAVPIPSGGWLVRTSGLLALVRTAAGWSLTQPAFHEFRVEAPAWKVWQGDGLGDKGVQSFVLTRDGRGVVIFNTHLQASYVPGGYAAVRAAQLRELALVAKADLDARQQPLPAVLAGDLNTRSDEPPFQELTAFWRELTEAARSRCGCGTILRPEGEGPWIDYVAAHLPDGWDVTARIERIINTAPDIPYSDHHGIDARIDFKAPSGRARLPLAALAGALAARPTTRRELLRNAALLLAADAFGGSPF